MSTFISLVSALEGWFDKPLAELPAELHQRVEDEFWPMPWERLTAAGRLDVAKQLDYYDGPATENLRQFSMDLAERRHQIKERIARWECTPTLNADQLHLQEQTLTELRRELAEIDATNFDAVATKLHAVVQLDTIPSEGTDKPPEVGSREWRSENARKAANARHDKPGGSRDKLRQIRQIWATGKYTSKDRCAEEECAGLDMSFSTARDALINEPEPQRC